MSSHPTPHDPLKPCPFCGCSGDFDNGDSRGEWIACQNCGCRTPTFNHREHLVSFWNTRYPSTPEDADRCKHGVWKADHCWSCSAPSETAPTRGTPPGATIQALPQYVSAPSAIGAPTGAAFAQEIVDLMEQMGREAKHPLAICRVVRIRAEAVAKNASTDGKDHAR